MPFDSHPEPEDEGLCPACGGYGLKSVMTTFQGKEAIASLPCHCPAGDEFRSPVNEKE